MQGRLPFVLIVLMVLCVRWDVARPALGASAPVDAMAVEPAAESPVAQTPEPARAGSCADLVTPERQIERDVPAIAPPTAAGSPELCLLYYPADAVYRAVLLRIDGPVHFRTVKAAVADRLLAEGFDLCGIGRWSAYGRFTAADPLQNDDLLDLPVTCPPRAVAVDAGAVAFTSLVQTSLERMRDLTAAQLGWTPNRPLTVLVVTDVDAAIDLYKRHVSPASYAEQLARQARSESIRVSVFGGLILFNATKGATEAGVDRTLAHEYTHFAQGGLGGSNNFFPKWLIEGMAVYQEVRNSASTGDVRFADLQQKAVAAGTAVPLAALQTSADWEARDRTTEGTDAIYGRAFVAYAYLARQFGDAVGAQLYRDNHNGSLPHFGVLLQDLTGADLAALDAAVGAWVLAASRLTGQDAEGRITVELSITPGGFHAPVKATFNRAVACGGGRVFNRGAWYSLTARVAADGSLSGSFTFADSGNTATVEGVLLAESEGVVTFRVANAAAGCDTGPMSAAVLILP